MGWWRRYSTVTKGVKRGGQGSPKGLVATIGTVSTAISAGQDTPGTHFLDSTYSVIVGRHGPGADPLRDRAR